MPETELDFLHDLPVELMWGVGPVTKARLAKIGVLKIGQLAKTRRRSLELFLGHAELARRQDAPVAGDDAVLAVDQHRVGEAKLVDAAGDLRDLGVAVGPRVARVGD